MWMLTFTLLPLMAIAYISWHVWCLLPWGAVWKTVVIALLAGSFLLLFANFFRLTDRLPMTLATAVYEIGTSSIFVLLYLFILWLVLDLGRLLHLLPRTLLYNNSWMTAAITCLMVVVFVGGHLHYKHKYREALHMTSDKVSHPTKILMVSDLHIGYHNQRDELHRWVDIINQEAPDVVLIAGDIIDGSMRPLQEQQMYQEFQRIQAPVYACLGNHEYFSGEPAAQRFYQQAGIRLLQDTTAVVGDLCIIGRDDRSNKHRKALGKIMTENAVHTADKFTILLDHQPFHLEQAERQHIDFQFSGHTHHGQVWPISWITESIYECAFGLYKKGTTTYYISSGLGLWGGKFRIGTRSEYVVLDISKK